MAGSTATVPVTVDNFRRAETELYLKQLSAQGAYGQFKHDRDAPAVDNQAVIRLNRDTLYSYAVLDLTSPATIVKADTGTRFQSLMVINQDHYIKLVAYKPGTYQLTQDMVGTRYAVVACRTFLNPADPQDVQAAHAAQDGIVLSQADAGKLELVDFDQTQRARLHDLLNELAAFEPDPKGRFGDENAVDPVHHLIYTSAGWGGNAAEDAIYISGSVTANDGTTPYVMTLANVPVDGFWSLIVYNKDGFFEAPVEAVSFNSVTAAPNADGTVTLHFGGDPQAPNYLRIMPGWNYLLRLYQPQQPVLDGSWSAPIPTPAE
nr:DUF1214 domain-containing protein [Novosphingobium panipatense]